MFRYELGTTPLLRIPLPGTDFCLTIKLTILSPFLLTFVCPDEFLS